MQLKTILVHDYNNSMFFRDELTVCVMTDVLLPGKTTELHPMGKSGLQINASITVASTIILL